MLTYAPQEQGFLEPGRAGDDNPATARAVIIPFGLEATVSYGGGTAAGPAAIIAASHQLELFDEELECEPYRDFGIATLEPPQIASRQCEALSQIADIVSEITAADRFPLILGGEHALTPGAIRPLVEKHQDLAILQIDAHADLRDGYLGEHFSHASAMRRALDLPGVSVVGVGIRSVSAEEMAFYNANRDRVVLHFAKDICAPGGRLDAEAVVASLKGRRVYVTFDVDGLDGAIMPATGTPVPGGLAYWQALSVIRAAANVANIVGGDVVELAPQRGLHVCDYTAAAVAYKIISYALGGSRSKLGSKRRSASIR